MFKENNIIKPKYYNLGDHDLRRIILKVTDTDYIIKFLGGKQLTVKWPIEGVNGDHVLCEKEKET